MSGRIQSFQLQLTDRQIFIVFDMKLGKQSGFQLLDELETNVPNVIITSAYSEFAIGAIKREVFDYLVKPVKPSELCASIDRLRSKTELKKTAGEELAGKGIPAFQKTRKMLLNSQKSTVLITLAELLWCKSDKNYTECALSNGNRVVISKTLKWFEEQLEPFGFYRVHHQYLINIWHISRLLQDGGLMVEMNNGDLVEVSRRKKAEFIREIGNRLTRPS